MPIHVLRRLLRWLAVGIVAGVSVVATTLCRQYAFGAAPHHGAPDVWHPAAAATFPERPMYEARDMGLLVGMANYAVANSGRQVDWLHLAGPRYLLSEDERFYRPLADLAPGEARVFLGIVLPIDGVPGLERRHRAASRFFTDFGVAMYCGFGRQPGQDGMETMREHRRVITAIKG